MNSAQILADCQATGYCCSPDTPSELVKRFDWNFAGWQKVDGPLYDSVEGLAAATMEGTGVYDNPAEGVKVSSLRYVKFKTKIFVLLHLCGIRSCCATESITSDTLSVKMAKLRILVQLQV